MTMIFAALAALPLLRRLGRCFRSCEQTNSRLRMLRKGLALLAFLVLSPAHATLIEYSFTSRVYSTTPPYPFFPGGLVGGTRINGGFVFDDAAPRTSYQEEWIDGGFSSTSTYDMGNLLFWAPIRDQTLTARGGTLTIADNVPISTAKLDRWTLSMEGEGEFNGLAVQNMALQLLAFPGPLTNSGLHVPNMADWPFPAPDGRALFIDLAFGSIVSTLESITRTTTSVPEPETLSLLAAGVLGALSARRRRHFAAN